MSILYSSPGSARRPLDSGRPDALGGHAVIRRFDLVAEELAARLDTRDAAGPAARERVEHGVGLGFGGERFSGRGGVCYGRTIVGCWSVGERSRARTTRRSDSIDKSTMRPLRLPSRPNSSTTGSVWCPGFARIT